MISTVAEMIMGNDTFKLLKADFSYFQQLQTGGRVSSDIRGGTFSVELESFDSPKYDQLANWMVSKSQMKKGVIRFYREDGIGRLFDFEFYDAYCISYTEKFDYLEGKPLRTILTISPGITRVRNLVQEKPWKISPLATLGSPPPPKQAPVRHFINFNVVDENGKPQENVILDVILPDGSKRTVISGADGMIEINNIPPGNCKIVADWRSVKINDALVVLSIQRSG